MTGRPETHDERMARYRRAQLERNGVYGTCGYCPRGPERKPYPHPGMPYPEECRNFHRADHQLTTWTDPAWRDAAIRAMTGIEDPAAFVRRYAEMEAELSTLRAETRQPEHDH